MPSSLPISRVTADYSNGYASVQGEEAEEWAGLGDERCHANRSKEG